MVARTCFELVVEMTNGATSGIDLSKFEGPDTAPLGVRSHPAYSTGSFLFDSVTGIGGLPVGRIIECYGPESSGKSTAFYQAIGLLQRRGGVGLILDFENAFLPWYGLALGMAADPNDPTELDKRKLLLEIPETLEAGFDKALEVTRACSEARVPLIVVFDSIAAMTPKAAIDSDAPSENNMAGAQRAKAIENYLRVATGEVARSQAAWCLVNHERDEIVTNPFAPGARERMGRKRTPGGSAVKYLTSMRVRFRPGAEEKGMAPDPVTGEMVETVVARKIAIYVSKNKMAPPFRKADAWIRFGFGFDNAYDLLEIGLARGRVSKVGNTHTFHDGGRAVGKANAIQYLRDHPVTSAQLESKLRELMESAWAEQQLGTLPVQEEDHGSDEVA